MLSNDGLIFGLLHGSIFVSTIYLSYISNPGSSLFSWHPFLMTLSMLFLANEAVLMFSPYWSLLPKKLNRQLLIEIHSYTQVAAFVGFNLGFAAIYVNKENNEKPHFSSWHGQLGLIMGVLFFSQISSGALAKYAKVLPVKLNVAKIKTLHDLLGAVVVLFSILNMVTACFTNFFASQTNILIAYSFSTFFVILYGFVSINVFKTNSRISALFK